MVAGGIFRYLSKVEKRRKSRLKEEWENVGTLKYIQEITKKLKI
ncbi:hypothetical protein [Mycoplasma mycoides]|nr:hypothetical protein [Mycoplasma mycoides]MDP4047571.1 hypothetical protein [Mycoplasma mycoides]MDP4058549.1 hypothetical protein [Mycoplasma mycoides]